MSSSFKDLGLRIAYNGKPFAGFQLQPHKNTVQEEMEKALQTVLRQKIRIKFTSRTDAGVHAYDQWVIIKNGYEKYLKLTERQKRSFIINLNGVLPEAIRVWQIMGLNENFHPKTSVEWKEYHYKVITGCLRDPVQEENTCWIIPSLDLKKMRDAQKELIGTHDFSSFCKQSGMKTGSTVRTILSASIQVTTHPRIENVSQFVFIFRGNGFLHNMVRNMVGTLIKIGQGKELSISKILKSKDRTLAGKNAPAHALILAKTKITSQHFQALS